MTSHTSFRTVLSITPGATSQHHDMAQRGCRLVFSMVRSMEQCNVACATVGLTYRSREATGANITHYHLQPKKPKWYSRPHSLLPSTSQPLSIAAYIHHHRSNPCPKPSQTQALPLLDPSQLPLPRKLPLQHAQLPNHRPQRLHHYLPGTLAPVRLDAHLDPVRHRVLHLVGGEDHRPRVPLPHLLAEQIAQGVVFFVEGEVGAVWDAWCGLVRVISLGRREAGRRGGLASVGAFGHDWVAGLADKRVGSVVGWC